MNNPQPFPFSQKNAEKFFAEKNPVFEFTEVRDSPINGLGIFARKIIPRGTIWWHARLEDIMLISRAQYAILKQSVHSPQIQDFLKTIHTYAYYEAPLDSLVLILDNARHVNHSFTPNSGAPHTLEPFCSQAYYDIAEGEEIVEDYTKYDPCPWVRLYGFIQQLAQPSLSISSRTPARR